MHDFIYVRKNDRYEKISFDELVYVRGMRGYMRLVTEREVYFILNTMKVVRQHLPENLFCQVHRCYIVAVKRIRAFDNFKVQLAEVQDDGKYKAPLAKVKEIPVGKGYRMKIKQALPVILNRSQYKNSKKMDNARFKVEYDLVDE